MSAKLFLVTQCGHVGGVEVQLHLFLTSALDRDKQSMARLGRFIHGKEQ